MKRILINDEIGRWGITADMIRSQLDGYTGDVEVVISSGGGDIFMGFEIHNILKEYDGGKVHIVIDALAASIASYIAMAGDTITVKSNSSFMIHNGWTWSVGDHRDLRHDADVIEGLTKLIANSYAAKTGREDIPSLMDDETWYFGQEIIDAGFADEILTVEDQPSKADILASAKQKFKACKMHTIEELEKMTPEQRAEARAACVQARDHPPEGDSFGVTVEPEDEIVRDAAVAAKMFKLTTGEEL